jgi:mRNA-degrading endonuclease RelE of RelBE toxin-antitoxin system
MAFDVALSPDAERHLAGFRAGEQCTIADAIDAQLRQEPLSITRNRKPLRSNPLAGWELRVGKFRVLYNVSEDEQLVGVVAIGVKVRERLLIEGKEAEL